MKYKHYIAELFVISLPIMFGNIGHTLVGATDVWIAAKHNLATLGAIAIANAIMATFLFVGIGLLSGISIEIANRRGERKPTKKYFLSGVVLSQLLALITFIILCGITKCVTLFNFEPKLVGIIQQYMYITSFSVFGMFLFQAIKEFLLAYEIVNFPNTVVLITVVVNAVLNWVFVFGIGSYQGMGAMGLAVATLLVRFFMGFCLMFYTLRLFKQGKRQPLFDIDYSKQVVKVGIPIGVAIFLEFLAFNIITVRLGMDDGLYSAVHNILITLINTAYMLPLSISAAMSIKIGFYNGAKNLLEIKRYSLAGLLISMLFMTLCSLAFLFKPETFIGIFTQDKTAFELAVNIVPYFSIFVIADGLQISLGGILKGLKMTKTVSACILSAYWFVGVPLGFFCAYKLGMHLLGFWIGLTVSVGVIALLEIGAILSKLRYKLYIK